jgi:hypothetical protein
VTHYVTYAERCAEDTAAMHSICGLVKGHGLTSRWEQVTCPDCLAARPSGETPVPPPAGGDTARRRSAAEVCGCPAKPGEPCPFSDTECVERIKANMTDAERAEVAAKLAALRSPSPEPPAPVKDGLERAKHLYMGAAMRRVEAGGYSSEAHAAVAEADRLLARLVSPAPESREALLLDALVRVRAHTSYVNPTIKLLQGLLFSIERIVDAALASPAARREEQVTRLTVVDDTGRAYERWNVAVALAYQDDGRTLKVFVSPSQSQAKRIRAQVNREDA